MNAAIEVSGLRKSFSGTDALSGLDLTVEAGTVVALLGPNGAGKTTAVRILSTLLLPDAGTATVAGHDVVRAPNEVRARIGVTGQFSALDTLLTGRENLRLMADLRHLRGEDGRRQITELLDKFDLADAADRPVATYSGGMQRRLDLAMTLLGEPRIVFLDEPTTGLDPRARREVWQIIRELVAEGVTILLTTQYLDEADRLANRVVVIDHGRVVAQGTPAELKRLVPGGHVRLAFEDPESLQRASVLLEGTPSDDGSLSLVVPTDGGARSLRSLLESLDGAHIPVETLSVEMPDLDDVFLTLTGGTQPAVDQENLR